MDDSDENGWLRNAESYYDDRERAIAKLDPAWAKAALYFRTWHHFGHSDGSIRAQSLLKIHERLEVYRNRFAGGNTLSLLNAVAFCAEENLPLPTWLAIAYRDALDAFLRPGEHSSLDKVFSSKTLPTSTPQKAAAAKQDWLLGGTIWHKVWSVAIEDESIMTLDAALISALAAGNFGVAKTKARTLFLMIDKNQSELIQSKPLSRYLELRRKGVTSK